MPYLTPDEPSRIIPVGIEIPDTLLPLVVGAIWDLGITPHWEEFGTMTVPEVLAAIGVIIQSIKEDIVMAQTPEVVEINPIGYFASRDGLFVTANDDTKNRVLYTVIHDPDHVGNYIDYHVTLSPGHYRLDILKPLGFGVGDGVIYLDGNILGSIVGYAGNPVWFSRAKIENIPVTADGTHVLRIVPATGDGYNFDYYSLTFTRTGD